MDLPMVLSLAQPKPAATPEPRVFEAIYAQHFRGIWRTLRRLGVTDAQLDDAAQDVFVVVHRKLTEFDGRSLRGWLYAIALRVASDYRRERARRVAIPLGEALSDSALGPSRILELNESVQLLHALLDQLDDPKRMVFVLGELEQLSAPEIAEALGENLNTVYARLRAARLQFDAALTRHRLRTERPAR